MSDPHATSPLALKKSLGYVALTIYGVGNMLGAGIYGLVGKAAGEMGNALWMAFAASMVAAGLTGLSYASIGSRYPKAGGAAFVVHRAFNWPMLAYVVGLVVMASGLTSMATTTQVFAEYFHHAVGVAASAWSTWAVILALVALLVGINFWGLRESAWLNAVCTLIETGGLLLVIAVGMKYWGSVNYLDASAIKNPSGDFSASLILTGAVLTFYSFIGFEDMLNVSEEVKNPRRTFPLALVSALLIATLVYMAVCVTVVSVLPHHDLARAQGPLAEVMRVAAPWFNNTLFSIMAMFAVMNTALLNYIMGSRLAYGMSKQGLLPAFLGRLHPTRRTPHVAILMIAAIVLVMVAVGNLSHLARATSILLLMSFTVVNASLIVLQWRQGEKKGGFEVPTLVPAGGIVVCLAMIVSSVLGVLNSDKWQPLLIVAVIVATVVVLYFVLKPRHAVIDEEAMDQEFDAANAQQDEPPTSA